MRTRRGAALVAVAAITAGIAGCGRQAPARGLPDALAALAMPNEVTSYGEAFWAQQARARAGLWSKADAFCHDRDVAVYPNCRPVRSVSLFARTLERGLSGSPGLDGSTGTETRGGEAEKRLRHLGEQRVGR